MNLPTLSMIGGGWVTPWGSDPERIAHAVLQGERAPVSQMEMPWRKGSVPYHAMPTELEGSLDRLPRLRRASAISYAAVGAAQEALRGVDESVLGSEPGRRAVVFAASDGSVVCTRKFFSGIEETGPAGGSPLLFPETVFNAPASHLCATLGWTGEALSLVGDGGSGLQAGVVAGHLLAGGGCDVVLVVAAQEADPISLEAYGAWGIGAGGGSNPQGRATSVCFAEGAGAALFCAGPGALQVRFHPGLLRKKGDGVQSLLEQIAADLGQKDGEDILAVLSGSSPGDAEARAVGRLFPLAEKIQPRRYLGEALCAASLWQLLLAGHLLKNPVRGRTFRRAFVPVVGYQGQVAGALMEYTGRD